MEDTTPVIQKVKRPKAAEENAAEKPKAKRPKVAAEENSAENLVEKPKAKRPRKSDIVPADRPIEESDNTKAYSPKDKNKETQARPISDAAKTAVFVPIKGDTAKKVREEKKSPLDTNKSEDSKALLRQKSDRRFWSRFFSLGAIIPAYLALLVYTVFLPRSTVSNIEKRNLAKMPEFTWGDYWSGKYTSDMANYFDDTVPFRDSLKQAASRFTGVFGIKYNNVQVTGTMEVVNKPSDKKKDAAAGENESSPSYAGSLASGTSSDKKKDSDEDTKQVKGEEIAEGVYANGVIVVYQNGHYRAMSMYGGGSGEVFASAVNDYASDLPGVRVYSLVAPTASEFYTPENFADYNASQEDDIKDINEMLNGATGINVCPALLAHKQETIYTRTDHHWMSLGAYYAAKEFADAAGVQFRDLSQYNKLTKPDYVGTLYTFSGNNPDLLNDPEDFIYYVPKKQDYTTEYYDYSFNFVYEGEMYVDIQAVSEYYSTFISGDAYSVKIKTGVKNGRRCLVIKDSYGDALIPFLSGSFEEVYVVDMRYFERNLVDFAKEMKITDMLFTCCSYSAVGPNADHLEEMRIGGITGSIDDHETSSKEPEDEDVTSSEEPQDDLSDESELMEDDADYDTTSKTVSTANEIVNKWELDEDNDFTGGDLGIIHENDDEPTDDNTGEDIGENEEGDW